MYPAYQTFKALDGKDKEAKGQLLRYWAVFATFTAAEFYTDMLVSWLPFYYEVKMLILLYLSIPFTKGSSTVYEMHMKPWLRAHQSEIDEAIAQFKAATLAHLLSYRDRVASWCHQSISVFLKDKVPSLLPLYTMGIALACETFKHLFSPTPNPQEETSLANAQISNNTVTHIPIAESASLTVPVAPVVEIARPPPSEAPEIGLGEENIAPAPLLANATAVHAKTTLNIRTTRASHKRDSSAPVTVQAEPKSQKAKKHLSGTPMPARPLSTHVSNTAKPVSQSSSKKENVIVSSVLLEEDSICLSPSKRSSNPRLQVAPIRRGIV
jgi:hypothetical protein